MIEKILTPIFFLTTSFLITCYGYFTGKIATKGTYLGIEYDSVFVRSLITQFEYIWVLIIVNFFFSIAFNWGLTSYKNFLIVAIIWLASGPIAALIFNLIFTKEKIDLPIIIGFIMVTAGAILTVAHKEIGDLLK